MAAPSFGTSGTLFGMKAGCRCSCLAAYCPTAKSVIDGAVVGLGCSVMFNDANGPLTWCGGDIAVMNRHGGGKAAQSGILLKPILQSIALAQI